MTTIKANNGKVYMRIYDGIILGNIIHLGIDFSTGVPREDKEEYYEQIDEPIESYHTSDYNELNPPIEP